MTDLPTLNLTCLKNPDGRCVLVAESCVNCRNRGVAFAYAAAYQEEAERLGEQVLHTSENAYESLQKLRKSRDCSMAARDTVLKIAGLTTEDLEVK